jgi:hypothetical protein
VWGAQAPTYACARVAFIIRYAVRPHIVICGLSGSTAFFVITSQTTPFSGEGGGGTEYKMCVVILSTILSETFLILRSIQPDIVINVKTSSCKVTVILVGF